MSRAELRVGVCGVGTVGLATLEILRRQSLALTARCGQALSVTCVGSRREHPDHDYGDARVSRDVMNVARDPEVDVLVELIGGTGVAYDLIKLAIEQGKHVVTANKALIAEQDTQMDAEQETHVAISEESVCRALHSEQLTATPSSPVSSSQFWFSKER